MSYGLSKRYPVQPSRAAHHQLRCARTTPRRETRVTPENQNLGQTGETSGSPVFDHEGFIVAVSCCGIAALVVDEQGFSVMIPIGDLDFGIRVDLWALIDLIEAGAAALAAESRYTALTCLVQTTDQGCYCTCSA